MLFSMNGTLLGRETKRATHPNATEALLLRIQRVANLPVNFGHRRQIGRHRRPCVAGMVGMALSITSGTMRRLLCKGLFFKILDPGRERTNRMKLSSFGRMRPFWQRTCQRLIECVVV